MDLPDGAALPKLFALEEEDLEGFESLSSPEKNELDEPPLPLTLDPFFHVRELPADFGSSSAELEPEEEGKEQEEENLASRQEKEESEELDSSESYHDNEEQAGEFRQDDQVYCCPHCEYETSRRYHLTRHVRSHTGIRHLRCKNCSYRTNDSGALARHARTHSGDKPFSCTVCSARFTQKSHLDRHKLTHSGEKPHACPHCSHRTAHRYALLRHIRKLHDATGSAAPLRRDGSPKQAPKRKGNGVGLKKKNEKQERVKTPLASPEPDERLPNPPRASRNNRPAYRE